MRPNLFEWGEFTSHAGNQLQYKIECDAFTNDDWDCLAKMVMQYETRPFSSVEGIPRGGVPFANALSQFATGKSEHQPMIVDDIYTTGKSFYEYRKEHYDGYLSSAIITWVVFARGPVPNMESTRALFYLPGSWRKI